MGQQLFKLLMKQPGKALFIAGQFARCPALNETPVLQMPF